MGILHYGAAYERKAKNEGDVRESLGRGAGEKLIEKTIDYQIKSHYDKEGKGHKRREMNWGWSRGGDSFY